VAVAEVLAGSDVLCVQIVDDLVDLAEDVGTEVEFFYGAIALAEVGHVTHECLEHCVIK